MTLASVMLLGAPGVSAASSASAVFPGAGAAEAVTRASGTVGSPRPSKLLPGLLELLRGMPSPRARNGSTGRGAPPTPYGWKPVGPTGAPFRRAAGSTTSWNSTPARTSTSPPPPSPGDGSAAVIDGVKVSLQDADGRSCDVDTATFGAAAAAPGRRVGRARDLPRKSLCQDAGTYYVTVERADPDGKGASPDAWELELTTASEPRLERTGATTAPEEWDSASPRPVTGKAQRRSGGAGFTEATPLDEGVWRDDIRPGQTLFYKVPVDWPAVPRHRRTGQCALRRHRVRPRRPGPGPLQPRTRACRGRGSRLRRQTEVGQPPPLPRVAYANRHATGAQVGAMRFAGSYYLVAHLRSEVADDFGDGPVPLTLRVRVGGAAQDGPEYAGSPPRRASSRSPRRTARRRPGAVHGRRHRDDGARGGRYRNRQRTAGGTRRVDGGRSTENRLPGRSGNDPGIRSA
ncbi:hypothetical protein ACR6C2_23565 [Streptomyces sp. INA 01156]